MWPRLRASAGDSSPTNPLIYPSPSFWPGIHLLACVPPGRSYPSEEAGGGGRVSGLPVGAHSRPWLPASTLAAGGIRRAVVLIKGAGRMLLFLLLLAPAGGWGVSHVYLLGISAQIRHREESQRMGRAITLRAPTMHPQVGTKESSSILLSVMGKSAVGA